MDRTEELEHKIRELEDKIREFERQLKMLMSAHSVLIEQYALVEEQLNKLSRTLELNNSNTSPVSPLLLTELQERNSEKSKSRLEQLIDQAVDSIFEDYKQQFRGEG